LLTPAAARDVDAEKPKEPEIPGTRRGGIALRQQQSFNPLGLKACFARAVVVFDPRDASRPEISVQHGALLRGWAELQPAGAAFLPSGRKGRL